MIDQPKRGETREACVHLLGEVVDGRIVDHWEAGDSPACRDCLEGGHDESGFSYNDGEHGEYRVTYCASHEPGAGEVGAWLCDEHLITEAVERDTSASFVIFGAESGTCPHLAELEDHVLFAKLRDRLHDVAESKTMTQRIEANARTLKLVRDALERERAA
jgi:hypothetical protein